MISTGPVVSVIVVFLSLSWSAMGEWPGARPSRGRSAGAAGRARRRGSSRSASKPITQRVSIAAISLAWRGGTRSASGRASERLDGGGVGRGPVGVDPGVRGEELHARARSGPRGRGSGRAWPAARLRPARRGRARRRRRPPPHARSRTRSSSPPTARSSSSLLRTRRYTAGRDMPAAVAMSFIVVRAYPYRANEENAAASNGSPRRSDMLTIYALIVSMSAGRDPADTAGGGPTTQRLSVADCRCPGA